MQYNDFLSKFCIQEMSGIQRQSQALISEQEEKPPPLLILHRAKPTNEQTQKEYQAFCKECIQFYIRRFSDILWDIGIRNGWQAGEEAAQKYLCETFSQKNIPDSAEQIDWSILEEIRTEVFQLAEKIRISLYTMS